MKMIFMGPPGSGKGTQSKVIAKDLGIAHISMGDILREAIKNETEVGKKAAQYLKEGKLVPDEVVNEIAKEAIKKNAEKGFVLDGYPRTVKQAQFVASVTGIDKVIYIDVAESEIVKRLTGRRSCKNCGAVYHVKEKTPLKDGICDVCGGGLYIRNDDKEETIKTRFEVYEKETSPLIDFYKDITAKINGVGKLEDVLGRIKAKL